MIYEGLISRNISNSELKNILSKIFNVHRQKIFITKDVYDINIRLEDDIEILGEQTAMKGEFLSKISIYLRSQNLKQKNLAEEKVFKDICNFIGCKCLISDDSHNPFTMILLDSSNKENISLIPEDLDNNIYTIQK